MCSHCLTQWLGYSVIYSFTNLTILQPFIYRGGNGQIQLTKTILFKFPLQIEVPFASFIMKLTDNSLHAPPLSHCIVGKCVFKDSVSSAELHANKLKDAVPQ